MTIKIFTDGACRGNPGPGGWGAVIQYIDRVEEISGSSEHTTNNRMELLGAIQALKTLPTGSVVVLSTDSQYVKNGITTWIHGWHKNGWKTSKREDVKNKDLWLELLDLTKLHHVHWEWVKGHNGHPGNERADTLATQAI